MAQQDSRAARGACRALRPSHPGPRLSHPPGWRRKPGIGPPDRRKRAAVGRPRRARHVSALEQQHMTVEPGVTRAPIRLSHWLDWFHTWRRSAAWLLAVDILAAM